MILSPPSLLSREHNVADFDCGNPLLNNWLKRFAWQNQQANAAKTFVISIKNQVVGFYSLAVGSVEHIDAPDRVKKGLALHPIPVMILARLAVDQRYQGKKLGRGLLKDALRRTLQASEYAGIRAIFVYAKDDSAREFYESFGFEPSPVDPLKLMLLVKDAKKTLEADFTIFSPSCQNL